MMSLHRSWPAVLCFAIAGLATACSTSEVAFAPEAQQVERSAGAITTRTPVPTTRPPAMVEGDEITLFGEGGTSYTLNVARGEITVSDGRVVGFDPDLTAILRAEFRGTIETDPTAADLIAAVQDTVGGWCGLNLCPLELRAAVEVGSGATPSLRRERVGRSVRRVLWRRLPDSDRLDRRGRRSSVCHCTKALCAPLALPFALFGDAQVASSMEDDICTDIANAALPAVLHYQTRRTGFLAELLAAIGGEVFNAAAGRVVTSGSFFGAMLADLAADHANATIAVSILGTFWNINNCRNRSVRIGPVIRTGTNSPSGMLVCHYEPWQISFNGGLTWNPITVKVCEYEAT